MKSESDPNLRKATQVSQCESKWPIVSSSDPYLLKVTQVIKSDTKWFIKWLRDPNWHILTLMDSSDSNWLKVTQNYLNWPNMTHVTQKYTKWIKQLKKPAVGSKLTEIDTMWVNMMQSESNFDSTQSDKDYTLHTKNRKVSTGCCNNCVKYSIAVLHTIHMWHLLCKCFKTEIVHTHTIQWNTACATQLLRENVGDMRRAKPVGPLLLLLLRCHLIQNKK